MTSDIAPVERPIAEADGATPPVLAELGTPVAPSTVSINPGSAPLHGLLTQRQIEVLNLLSIGQSNKQIAHTLGIREGTVKIHLGAIFRALRARNRTAAVVAAQALVAAESFGGNKVVARSE
ncbi:response regulator transcription factor [Ottowia sp. GY511]|uniref:Response regulator transcription factor n=1 Tax=Ottowia flava TaxID=2675430 RepID=A0ABW4KWB7_9BURK|nr:LuxR C-terminal-related transcriptional regulator [Ottowia sp. GY511]TXK26225.1 response regulator transcription factor [Ottowia sp. GY511]